MGAAAEHRGNALIRDLLGRDHDQQLAIDGMVRAVEIAEQCNAFVTQAMSYLAEPRGLRQKTVENAKSRRGWAKRHAQVCLSHNAWVDVDAHALAVHWHVFEHLLAGAPRCQAVGLAVRAR